MVDKSDFNKLKEKLDIGGIMGSLKSMINPSSGTPEVNPDDDLGVKIAQASTLLRQMAEAQQAQVKDLQKVNALLNAIFQDIQLLRDKAHDKQETKPVEKSGTE